MYKIILAFLTITMLACSKEGKEQNMTISKTSNKIKISPKIATKATTLDTTTTQKITKGLNKAIVLGKFSYTKNNLFVKLATKHSSKSIYLQKKTYQAFIKMYNAAQKENVSLRVISGTRTFYQQKAIWKKKWMKYSNLKPKERAIKILSYSAMPCTSRHHWGTDIDINQLSNSYFTTGKGLKEYQWLIKNAAKFGFYQVYSSKNNGRTGYKEEKWHWSYLPIAKHYLAYYNKNINYTDITGFKGADSAKKLKIITKYVNGISVK